MICYVFPSQAFMYICDTAYYLIQQASIVRYLQGLSSVISILCIPYHSLSIPFLYMDDSGRSYVWKSFGVAPVLYMYSSPLWATFLAILMPFHIVTSLYSSFVEWSGFQINSLDKNNSLVINIWSSCICRSLHLYSPDQALNHTSVPANYSCSRYCTGTLIDAILILGLSNEIPPFTIIMTPCVSKCLDLPLITFNITSHISNINHDLGKPVKPSTWSSISCMRNGYKYANIGSMYYRCAICIPRTFPLSCQYIILVFTWCLYVQVILELLLFVS